VPKTILCTTSAGGSDTNGGMYESPVTYAQCYNTNGAPVSSTTAAAGTNNGSGNVRITKTGAFTSALVGMYAYVDWAATYTDGWYLISARTNDTIDLVLAWTADATGNTVKVGGAFATFNVAQARIADQDTLKVIGGPYTAISGDSAVLRVNTDPEPADSTAMGTCIIEGVVESTGVVSAATRNLDGSWNWTDGLVEVNGTPGTAINGIRIMNTAFGDQDRFTIRGFKVYGCSGAGIGNNSGGNIDNCTVRRCEVYSCGASANGGIILGNSSDIAECNVYNITGSGCYAGSLGNDVNIRDCYISACTRWGINPNGNGDITGNYVYDCGTENLGLYGGIKVNFGVVANNCVRGAGTLVFTDDQGFTNVRFTIINNTLIGTDAASTNCIGLELQATTDARKTYHIAHNIIKGCYYGEWDIRTIESKSVYNNCWHGNTVDVREVSTDTNDRGLNPITSDPLLSDTANEDFRLQSGSPCYSTSTGRAVGALGLLSSGGGSRNVIIGG
jgi:hypothetical protein